MAILQQPGTGYRDPSKAMSIKALQSRAKAAQEAAAQATQIQNPIVSPTAGLAHLAGVAAAGWGQSRAENAEADARGQLAQIMSGIGPEGPTPQQTALINQLDPDLGSKIFENAMEARRQEDQQKHAMDLQSGQQTFLSGESVKDREARIAEQQATFGHQDTTARTLAETQKTATTYEDQLKDENARDEAAAKAKQAQADAVLGTDTGKRQALVDAGQMTAEEAARLDKLDADKKAADLASTERTGADPYTGTGDIEADYNAGKYGAPGSPEAIKLRDQAHAAENLKGTPTPAPGSDYLKTGQQEAAKRHGEIVKAGNAAPAFMSDIRRISELGKQIGTGKWAQIKAALYPYAEMLPGVDLEGLGEMQAFEAIADKLAPQMRPDGSGSTSNYDAQQFLRSLPQLGNDPEGNKIIEATFQALEQHKVNAAALASRALKDPSDPQYLPWNEVDAQIAALPYPYELYNKFVGSPSRGGGGGTEPPAAAGGGDVAPTIEPGDVEGDTANNGEWVVRGGKWVKTR